MFRWLNRKWRLRVASLVVALYAFCLAAPAAVMAFEHSGIPAHCLTADHVSFAVHKPHDGASHHHQDGKSNNGDHDGKCCGLFGVTAIAPEVNVIAAPLRSASTQPSLVITSLTGRTSDRIDRPPRSSLSL